MDTLLLNLLELSISGSVLALVVMALRLVLRSCPRWVFCLLWGLVALRLVCPVSVQSNLSLQPSTRETLTQTIAPQLQPSPNVSPGEVSASTITTPITAPVTNTPTITGTLIHHTGSPATTGQSLLPVFGWVWAVGTVTMLLFALTSYLRLRYRMATATRLEGNLYQSEWVSSPFILGLVRPRIYLPYHLDGEIMAHVIAHEQSHLRRGDHWWKPLGYLLLSVYWFCPVLWLAYWLLCRDIELACDERVIQKLHPETRRGYAMALLELGVRRASLSACPLAFGEVGVKNRVKRVMNHKKPTFWIILLAVIATAVVAVCFLTDPKAPETEPPEDPATVASGESLFLQSDNPAYATETSLHNTEQSFSPGQMVFQNPDAAFEAMLQDYAAAIAYLEKRNGLDPLTRENYRQYQNSIRNIPDDALLRTQYEDLYRFFDLYGNSLSEQDVTSNSIVSLPKAMPYGDFTIGQFLMQNLALSYRPEGSGEYQEIHLDIPLDGYPDLGRTAISLCVTNKDGQTIYSSSNLRSMADIHFYTRQELLLMLEEQLLYTADNQPASEQWDKLIPETVEEIQVLHYPRTDDTEEIAYCVYCFDGIPTWFAEGHSLRFYAIVTSSGSEVYARSTAQTPLDAAVSQAILDRLLPETPDELVYCESHVNLTQETVIACGPVDSPDCGTWTTVYTMVMESVFSLSGGAMEQVSGSHYPAAITFREEEDGSYTLTEFWTPRDGSYYAADIREKFPDQVETDALDTQKFVLSQSQNCYAQVLDYTGIQPDSALAKVLLELVADAGDQQTAAGCIEPHVRAYRELLSYGRYTLEYAFREFQVGERGDLSGEILAIACQEIMLQWGEAVLIDSPGEMTGQDWFDEFRANAYRLKAQHTRQEMEELYPGAWLLIQMENG